MKKLLWLVIIVLINSMAVIAQTTNDPVWNVFSGYQDEFTIFAPAGFDLVDFDKEAEDSLKGYRVRAVVGTYAVWTAKDKKSSYFPMFSKFIENNKAIGSDTLIDSFKSTVYKFTDSENASHQIAFVETDSRFFIFHTFGSTANKENFAKFFDSIKIKKSFSQSQSSSVGKKPENKSPSDSGKSVGQGTGQGSGTGIGTGSGQGIGSGQGSGTGSGDEHTPPKTETNKPAPIVEPLQILSKPRANYTDMARIYAIQGMVSLRVTFLANGTIGSVSPISALPLGLTNASIEAAKNLKFKPASRDGVPQTVTKTVQYNFTLY